jgi:hypothetical protein
MEVYHEIQTQASRPILVSKTQANVVRDFHPKQWSRKVIELLTEIKNYWKSSVAMISVHVDQPVGFKQCCMLTGEYDGSDRDHFFQGMK